MYSLELMDGTVISNLERLNPVTFQVTGGDSSIYFLLSDDNLTCATLYKDDDIEDIFIDYARQNFSCFNGVVRFRLSPQDKLI